MTNDRTTMSLAIAVDIGSSSRLRLNVLLTLAMHVGHTSVAAATQVALAPSPISTISSLKSVPTNGNNVCHEQIYLRMHANLGISCSTSALVLTVIDCLRDCTSMGGSC